MPPLGTQVDFYGSGHAEDTEPQLGFVTQDWQNGTVNVAVFDRNGAPLLAPPTQIPLVEAGAVKPEGPCCVVRQNVLIFPEGAADPAHVAEILEHYNSRLDLVDRRLDDLYVSPDPVRAVNLEDSEPVNAPITGETIQASSTDEAEPQGEDSPENAEAPAEEPAAN